MKSFSLIIIFSFFVYNSFSQKYSAQLINVESGQPVPFANIGIIGKNVGTASDVTGWFEMELNPKFDRDTLGISCIGYEKREYLIRDLKKDIGNRDQVNIELSPKSYQLKEVIVRPVKTKIYTLGNFCDPYSPYGNAFYCKKLGTEIGVIIKLPRRKNKAYLKEFRFYVGEHTFDTFPVRLNVYNLKNGRPDENILREPIFIELTSEGEYIIDLKKYNIITNGDFFISLEYYKIADYTEGKLVFCAVQTRKRDSGSGYYRLTSQGNWNPEIVANLGFSVLVECEK